jgi:hypothetical protein
MLFEAFSLPKHILLLLFLLLLLLLLLPHHRDEGVTPSSSSCSATQADMRSNKRRSCFCLLCCATLADTVSMACVPTSAVTDSVCSFALHRLKWIPTSSCDS